jgi:uncharacterized protein YbjQ (UPF0145 family)
MTDDEKRALVRQQPYTISPHEGVRMQLVSTSFTIEGHRIVKSLGVVRGIVVRSRSVIGSIGAAFQTIFGGNISILTNLCEQARSEAFHVMQVHAAQLGGNAIIGMRYDATELMAGVTEVLAYGTAVIVEPEAGAGAYC